MRTLVFTIGLLMIAGIAAAQSGPAPGYDNGVDYAASYVQEQGAAASTDPAGYAQEKADPEALGREGNHAAYMACWIADDAISADPTGACAQFYTAPQEVGPQADPEVAANETDEAAEVIANATDEAVAATEEFVAEVLEDPTNAPSALQKFLDAMAATLTGTVDSIAKLLDMSGQGIAAYADASLATLDATVTGIGSGMDASAGAYQAIGTGITDGAAAATDGISSSAQDVGVAVAGAADASGAAIASAATTVAEAASSTTEAVGEFVSSTAQAIAATVSSWFSGDEAKSSGLAAPAADGATGEATSLLGKVGDTVDDLTVA